MYKIWIVDSDSKYVDKIQEITNSYFKNSNILEPYETVSITEAFMAEIMKVSSHKCDNCQIFIMETSLNQTYSGFQLGKTIRSFNPNAYLIYVTHHIELMEQVFMNNLKVLNYISKTDPLMEKRLVSSYEQIIKERHLLKGDGNHFNPMAHNTFLKYHYKDMRYLIPFHEIVSIETNTSKRGLLIQTVDDTFPCQFTIKGLAEKLPEYFKQIHRSSIINIHFIRNIRVNNTQFQVITRDQKTYPISKKYLDQLLEQIDA